jgi:hypothetical protein
MPAALQEMYVHLHLLQFPENYRVFADFPASEFYTFRMRQRVPLLRYMANPWPVRCSPGVSIE